jgi:hypothetical protein
MRLRRCWGIFREHTHSPGRESDDTEILRLTAKVLEARGFEVEVKSSEEIVDSGEPPPPAIFIMCERIPVLQRLQNWHAAGVRIVNVPRAVLDTYRERTVPRWEAVGIASPASRVVPTRRPWPSNLAPGPSRYPIWVKRGDVHYTEEGDVVRASTAEAIETALAALARRGISQAVLQAHVEGDLLKFYGIGHPGRGGAGAPAPWFRHFYHRDQQVQGYPFDPQALIDLARRGADALGLEVFGGDAIVTPTGDLVLIDLNAWPSFALFRDEAAVKIAAYLEYRFTRG